MIEKTLPVLPAKDFTYNQRVLDISKSDHNPKSRVHSKTGTISKYHEKCHSDYEDLTLETKIDHRIKKNISEMKRMILTIRMAQTPLEMNYSGRQSLLKHKIAAECGYDHSINLHPQSKIPRPIWMPVSPYKPISEDQSLLSGRQFSESSFSQDSINSSKRYYRKGPFLKSLIPDITPLSYKPELTESAFRSRFVAQYERGYNDITTKKRSPHVWVI